MSHRIHSSCRACSSTDLTEVFSHGVQPLANDFSTPDGEHKGHYPVRVLFCRNCSLAQLGEVVDPAILYTNYAYTTSSSATMLRHFDRLIKDVISETAVEKPTLGSLCEIGANDGLFLDVAKNRGFNPVIGIDPAKNLSGRFDVPIVRDFFNESSAAQACIQIGGEADTVVARHVFCHQEWKPFIKALDVLSHAKTLCCIEVPWCVDLLRKAEADSIYSEHTSYLTLKSVAALLKDTRWHIHSVERYSIHGGAVLIMLRRNDSGIERHLNADEMLAEENVTEGDWIAMGIKWQKKVEALVNTVDKLRSENKIVSGFGASAKGSVLINACGFDKDAIAFVTDNSPFKPGKLIPGTNIPVIAQDEMLSEHPDYSVLFCWNFQAEVLASNTKWRDRGGKFIIPTADGVEIV